MINHIRAEIYRIMSKKSLYVFLGALLVLYAIMMVIQYGGHAPDGAGNIVTQSKTLFSLMAILGGCFLFFAVYTDDLTAKTLPALIGFGKKRAGIVIAKLVVMVLFTVAMFVLTLFAFRALFSAMGYATGGDVARQLWSVVLEKSLMVVAFTAVSSVVVYGTQKAVLSVVLFAFLSSGIISQLLINFLDSSLVQGMVGSGVSDYTVIPIITAFVGGPTLATVVPYMIYLGLFVALSIVAFSRKELEF